MRKSRPKTKGIAVNPEADAVNITAAFKHLFEGRFFQHYYYDK